jgi:hypothetical protein
MKEEILTLRKELNEAKLEGGKMLYERDNLQSRLDAIGKVSVDVIRMYHKLEPMLALVCDEEVLLDESIEALDRLIGGEKE